MSLDLSVVLKDRLTKERLASLHAFLTRKRFIKEKLGSSSFFYFSIEPSISIDVFLIEAPMKRDNFWRDLHANVKRVAFPPKSAICMESRHTEASHLKMYSLGKALARRFGGIVFDHQMSRAYTARGKPIFEPGEEKSSLHYGAAIGPFMETLALLMNGLQAGQVTTTPGRKRVKGSVQGARRNLKAAKS